MKITKFHWIIAFSLIFLMIAEDADAQRKRYGRYRSRRGKSNMALLHSINFGAGYYKPGMNYWNEESFLVDREDKFDGGLMLFGGVELRVLDNILLGVYGGSFKDKVQTYSLIGGAQQERYEDISYRISPISGQVKYEFSFSQKGYSFRPSFASRIHPYVGAGINYNIINQKFVRDFTSPERRDLKQNQVGSGITYSGIAGVNFDLTRSLGVGLEMNYYFGAFDQYVSSSEGQSLESISLTGPSFNGKIYLKFPQRRGFYRPRGR